MGLGRREHIDAHVRANVVIDLNSLGYLALRLVKAIEPLREIFTLENTVDPLGDIVLSGRALFGHADPDVVIFQQASVLEAVILHSAVRVMYQILAVMVIP